MNSKPLFIFGNGLSIALSSEFSLKTITEKFIESLDGYEKTFLEGISSSQGQLSFDDFETNFAAIEASLASLIRYRKFLDSELGQNFIFQFQLTKPDLLSHELIIQKIYRKYIARILELIHGNVRKAHIEARLKPFKDFLAKYLGASEKGYVFTLNYDLLVETLLLDTLGSLQFTDFCYPSQNCRLTGFPKYDFNPGRSMAIFPDSTKVELHHLHGSLSLFYDIERNRTFKYESQDIGLGSIYKRIYNDNLPIIPAIITGGGKSEKIVEYPFDWYYRSLKDLADSGQPSSLYIVGYSFRDSHINELIKRWMNNVKDYSKGLLIVDYQKDEANKKKFISIVRKALHKKTIDETCFEFNGANNMREVEGTQPKKS